MSHRHLSEPPSGWSEKRAGRALSRVCCHGRTAVRQWGMAVALLLTSVLPLAVVANSRAENWQLIFEDQFDGPAGAAPNASYWTLAGQHTGIDPTHGASEQQLYTPERVKLDGAGHCVIETRRERRWYPGGSQQPRWYNFTSGMMQSTGKVNATYGKWAVRARLPDPKIIGIWPAHWMIPEPSPWNCWPVGGEIDIMEMNGGVYGNTVVGTYSWSKNCSAGEPDPQPPLANCTCGCGCDLFFSKDPARGGHGVNGHYNCTETSPWTCKEQHDFSKAFHVFSITWSAREISWAVDDRTYFVQRVGVPQGLYVPQWPMYFILNTAIQPQSDNREAGAVGPYPAEHVIDWVRIYQAGPARVD